LGVVCGWKGMVDPEQSRNPGPECGPSGN
jgi:hypothetical protein